MRSDGARDKRQATRGVRALSFSATTATSRSLRWTQTIACHCAATQAKGSKQQADATHTAATTRSTASLSSFLLFLSRLRHTRRPTMALSIFVPIGYITVLVVSLSIFSKVYRKRTAQALAREHGQSWFVEGHPERDIYQTLVQSAADAQQKQQQGGAGAAVTIPDVVLKAALLNRAMADVRRIIRMRDDKQALAVLLQKGSIGDDMMAKIVLAEKELEAEILDVVSEANTFREGWGQLIFPSASEMVAHLKHKEAYHFVPQQRADESEIGGRASSCRHGLVFCCF